MARMAPEADEQLLQQALNLNALLNLVGLYCYTKDAAGRYTFVNEAVCALFARPREAILGRDDSQFFEPQHSMPVLQAHDRRVLEDGEVLQEEEGLQLLGAGEPHLFWSIKVPLYGDGTQIIGLCGISMDLTGRQSNSARLLADNRLLSTVLGNVEAFIYQKAADGRYLFVNDKVARLYGRPIEAILGRTDRELLPPEVAEPLMQLDRQVFDSGLRQAREEWVAGDDGRPHAFWSIKVPLQLPGQPPSLIGFSSEITELLNLREQMEWQRTTDTLTGLDNRARFEQRLEEALQRGEPLAVLLIDLDQFKQINTTLGHNLGNALLHETAQRLRVATWQQASPARFAANTFAVLVPTTAADAVARHAESLRRRLAEPYLLAGHRVRISASVGISLFPADAGTAAELLTCAETGLYLAKERGRDQTRFYARSIGEAVAARARLELDLRHAVAEQGFELYYQPKLTLAGRVCGVEALLRWAREGHGMVSPAEFIPLAEKLGLINQLGDWVIEQACRQLRDWQARGLELTVAVNLSPLQLVSADLVERVACLLQEHGIGRGRLAMEVTESMMLEDPEAAIERLHALRGLGIPLHVDDFGTGYSSFAYLKRMPVEVLKLDRSFVMAIDEDPREADLVAGIFSLAHRLGMQVVAEGVERASQQAVLASCGCDQVQGYLHCRPLPAAAVTDYLLQQAGVG